MMEEQTHALVIQAATLRIRGSTWREVAAAVGRSEVTVRQWPANWPAEWGACTLKAIDAVLPEVESEALARLRLALADKNASIACRAARALLEHCRNLRGIKLKFEADGPPPINLAELWGRDPETLTDAQLIGIAEALEPDKRPATLAELIGAEKLATILEAGENGVNSSPPSTN